MEYQHLINKIKSLYVLKNIFNYIQDNNIKFKLLLYSKSFQKKLNLTLKDYKEKYIDKIGFDLNKYLHKDNEADNLINKYNEFLLQKKLNKKEFKNIISDIIIERNNKNNNSDILIDMESPLLEIISRTKAFENNYAIYISQKNIDDNKLKEDYKNLFDN